MPVAHSGSPDRYYEGNFYVDEETRRNMNNVSDGINDYIPSSFRITPKGQLIMITDNGYPTFRSFPTFTTQKIKIEPMRERFANAPSVISGLISLASAVINP